MWSFGHFTLGLPRDWMRNYTFAEYYLLCDRWKVREQDSEYRASLIAACATNPHMKEPLAYGHFMRPQFRYEESNLEDGEIVISSATPEELIACFGPDFYSPAGGLL